jgi:hypothetical protein
MTIPIYSYGELCGVLALMPQITFAAFSGGSLFIQMNFWLTYYNGRLWKHWGREGRNL